jgi:hypothetical protein
MNAQTDRVPNFLVAGPTKCGTTSFSIYLNQHPDIFIPQIKEPNFLSSKIVDLPFAGKGSDEVSDLYVRSFEDYKNLYANQHEAALGDASANTIYYGEKIIPVIREYLGDPKIFILLRDPVKRAFSAYSHLVRDNREELSFEEALDMEEQRINENYDPLFHYTRGSLYARNVKIFKESFSNVQVLLTSDLYKNPDNIFRNVFEFMGVDPEFEVRSSQQHNISGKPKSQFMNDLVTRDTSLRKILRPLVRMFTTQTMRERMVSSIQKKNLAKLELDPQTESKLRDFFRTDVQELESVLEKDLSSWYR